MTETNPYVHGGGMALLFTEPQGEVHAPWGACVDGRLLTVPGGEIARALLGLRGPPKRGTLHRMMHKAEIAEQWLLADGGPALCGAVYWPLSAWPSERSVALPVNKQLAMWPHRLAKGYASLTALDGPPGITMLCE